MYLKEAPEWEKHSSVLKMWKKIYGSGEGAVRALHDASFTIGKGEICVIVGPSGAGKTTLLNILGGMDTLTSGRVFLNDREVSAFDRRQLADYRRRDIGFVFQFYNLYPESDGAGERELASQIVRDSCPRRRCSRTSASANA